MMFRLNTNFKNIRKICSPLFIYQICSLREKCPNTEFFWSAFSWIWTRKTPYLDTFHAMATQTKMNLLHFLSYFLNKNVFEMYTNWGSKDRNFIYSWKQISLTIVVHDVIYGTSVQRFESGSSAISIRNFHTSFHSQVLCNVTSSFKSIKKSKFKPALHSSLFFIQKAISSFSLSYIQKRISYLRSLCLIITVTWIINDVLWERKGEMK